VGIGAGDSPLLITDRTISKEPHRQITILPRQYATCWSELMLRIYYQIKTEHRVNAAFR
jgi:hypothetical protein